MHRILKAFSGSVACHSSLSTYLAAVHKVAAVVADRKEQVAGHSLRKSKSKWKKEVNEQKKKNDKGENPQANT